MEKGWKMENGFDHCARRQQTPLGLPSTAHAVHDFTIVLSPTTQLGVVPQGSLKTGQSGSLQTRPTVKARDIDVDGSPYRLCRHEQCLERRKETTSHRTGKARMVFTKDRARNRCTA